MWILFPGEILSQSAVILPGVKVKNTSILATPISKAQPQMENVRISAAVPDLKWLHNPACKIQTESQVCYSMQWFSRKFIQLKDYITNRQKLQVWLYVCNRHVLWRLISLPYETDLSGKSSMIRPLEVMCFFLYVLDYVNYQKLKLNFPQVIFRWDESMLVKSKDNSMTHILLPPKMLLHYSFYKYCSWMVLIFYFDWLNNVLR